MPSRWVKTPLPKRTHYFSGNEAAAEGAIAAGCRFYAGYPITPSSELMERMAVRLGETGGVFIQMEDEMASISSVLGASWAGAKAMTATSGPGFSLMQESIGYAAFTETPCVIIDVQRAGPGTGQATRVGAGDIMQAKWGSHGDYQVIAFSPWSVQEMFDFTVRAFNSSERYRVPAMVMADEAVAHLRETVRFPAKIEVWDRKKKRGEAPFGTEEEVREDVRRCIRAAGPGGGLTRIKQSDVIKKIERFNISGYVYDLETKNHHFCGGLGNVLLHNTDSLFLKAPSQDQVQGVVEWAKTEFGVDLDLDKEYRYVVFSTRKKNYLGVQKDGKVDVKGLTGKKSHTPPFIRNLFYEILEILSHVQNAQEFTQSKTKIGDMISTYAKKLKARQIPLTDLAFHVMLSKAPSEYVKTIPQHIRAAKLLESIREVKKGDIIDYVKIINKPGVKPVELARPDEVDTPKYMEFMESTFDQILSSMDLDFASLIGEPKQTGLDQFFWK